MWELGVRPENPSRLLGQRKHLPEGSHRSLPAPVPPPSSFPAWQRHEPRAGCVQGAFLITAVRSALA